MNKFHEQYYLNMLFQWGRYYKNQTSFIKFVGCLTLNHFELPRGDIRNVLLYLITNENKLRKQGVFLNLTKTG